MYVRSDSSSSASRYERSWMVLAITSGSWEATVGLGSQLEGGELAESLLPGAQLSPFGSWKKKNEGSGQDNFSHKSRIARLF